MCAVPHPTPDMSNICTDVSFTDTQELQQQLCGNSKSTFKYQYEKVKSEVSIICAATERKIKYDPLPYSRKQQSALRRRLNHRFTVFYGYLRGRESSLSDTSLPLSTNIPYPTYIWTLPVSINKGLARSLWSVRF